MNKKNSVGEKYNTNEGYIIEITEYINVHKCSIKFENGVILNDVYYSAVKTGQIKNPYHPSNCNNGYVGIGNYKTSIDGKHTRYYTIWKNI